MFRLFNKLWYQQLAYYWLLVPISWLYQAIITLRKRYYDCFPPQSMPVPIIVVGNLSVGGTGKTPLVIYLVELLQRQGYRPGIVSRGYGGQYQQKPLIVTAQTATAIAGDEAVLLANRTSVPVVIHHKRPLAVNWLLENFACDIVISDDGLQHYALARDLEIVVIDASRQLGNGWCLPAGPLREPQSRLQSVDLTILNGVDMKLQPSQFINLANRQQAVDADYFIGQTVHAVAAIGHPERFFKQLRGLGLQIVVHHFRDHYRFKASDFPEGIIVMTEKDAVKCQSFATERFWYLPVTAELSAACQQQLLTLIKRLQSSALAKADDPGADQSSQ